MARLAQSVTSRSHSGIREMADSAYQIQDVLRLEAGDPNFDTPSHSIEAAGERGDPVALSEETPYAEDAGGCKIFLSSVTHSRRASLSIP